MKVYISVDLEGITGVTSWTSTDMGSYEYSAAVKQMSLEALAACEAAIEMGAEEVVVKDSHETGLNLDLTIFPKEVKIISGWTMGPESMVGGIDESFDAVMFVGYHAAAGMNGNPLSHTMNRQNNHIYINGQLASEFSLHAYMAAYYGVPTVFLSGDQMICEHAKSFDSAIETVAVKEGIGSATVNVNPDYACQMIKEGAKKSLEDIRGYSLEVPKSLTMEINFKEHVKALRASYYPGVKMVDGYTVRYETHSMLDLMTMRMFVL